jgi:hypothetical protein
LDADDLILWKVDLPLEGDMFEHLNDLKPDPKESLSPWVKLLKVFSELPEEDHLHIVVQGPPASELSINIVTLSSTLMAV